MDRFEHTHRPQHRAARLLGLAVSVGLLALAPQAFASDTSEHAESFDAGALAALEHDLGMERDALLRRLAAERGASIRAQGLREALGARYAGAWVDADARGSVVLTVAVTDEKAAEMVQSAGAKAHLATRSLAELEAIQSELNGIAADAEGTVISAHYIDVKTSQVVAVINEHEVERATRLIAGSRVQLDAIRIESTEGLPSVAYDVRGGDRYNMSSGGFCSVGFSATRAGVAGFATAGHCGTVGTTTTGFNNISQGIFDFSTFPGADHAWVRITNPAWVLRPWVNNYAGGNINVIGEQEAPIGAAICRSGTSSQYRCGTIQAKNVTVNYAQGQVNGLWRISACVTGGDSGGSVITPAGHAQGVTSGGLLSGGTNCHLPSPQTYIQPWWPIRNAYGLSLVTTGGGAPPQITQFRCPDIHNSGGGTYMCYVEFTSASPATANWFSGGGGASSGEWHWGTCSWWTNVYAEVTVTNAHGSTSRTASFECPTGPIP